MWKTKFWLFQIVMLVMLSLLFGSPVFAGPPDHAKGKGAQTSWTAHNNHSDGHAQGGYHANDNAAFMGGDSTDDGDSGDDTSSDGGDEPTSGCAPPLLDLYGDGSLCV